VYRVSNIPLNVWDSLSLFPSSSLSPSSSYPFIVPSFIERLMARYGRCILRDKGVCVCGRTSTMTGDRVFGFLSASSSVHAQSLLPLRSVATVNL
jgi:hypothetical protein